MKTNNAAAVIIPPNEVWRTIQPIRARYDRHFARWMPHITLAYPFRPQEEFDELAPQLTEAFADIEPFEIELAEFRFFDHGRESYTVWLAANPPEPINALQAAIALVTPDCTDAALFATGFTPHLSLGQARGDVAKRQLLETLAANWQPLRFQVAELSLIWRNDPPDDAFRVGCKVGLGERKSEVQG